MVIWILSYLCISMSEHVPWQVYTDTPDTAVDTYIVVVTTEYLLPCQC